MDYYLHAISYQLPDFAQYRYCYLMMLFNAYIMLLCLVHVYDTKLMMIIIGLVYMKYITRNSLLC